MDQVIIRGLKLFAYHGVNPEEKRDGQPFLLDLTAHCDCRPAGESDQLEHAVNYAALCKTAAQVFTAASYNLIERAAALVAQAILADFPAVATLTVRVTKPQAPLRFPVTAVAVEITRSRDESHEVIRQS
ncbi:MAG: dihydroneopterin aldolase [Oscillospiraceae bacterium]|jgi:dihydroneopterin aldolase|nr:dihydroneopterin aldolase [Oscillospiraceae bacterium]